jgi:NADP-dependent 3-hydroxy acid dehydrogenase YdfG
MITIIIRGATSGIGKEVSRYLVLDTEKHQYLTLKVNSLFSLKRDFMLILGYLRSH